MHSQQSSESIPVSIIRWPGGHDGEMPELPEVETVCRGIAKRITGCTMSRFT